MLVERSSIVDSSTTVDRGMPCLSTGADIRAAATAVLLGNPVPVKQKPSIGCNIKWKRGNEPDYR